MTEGNKDKQYLKVLETYTRDVGRGVARIDCDSTDSSASTGDIIEKGCRCQIFATLPFR
jgi:transitional endoplasmic reticulum ATPase